MRRHLIKLPKSLSDKPLLTIAEAASVIRVSPKTMYRYVSERRKGLRGYRIGGNVRIKADEFLRWIDVNAISA